MVVAAVRDKTPRRTAGLAPGRSHRRHQRRRIRDVIDFQFHGGDARLRLRIERAGAQHSLRLTRRRRVAISGLELQAPKPARDLDLRQQVRVLLHPSAAAAACAAACTSKTTTYRLSFLHGNYITLTDLDEAAFARIVEQRLSPLYISVHATDPELRHGSSARRACRRAPAAHGAAGQGGHPDARADRALPGTERRRRTSSARCASWRRCTRRSTTTAVVPVGLTRHRERLPSLRTLTEDEARDLVHTRRRLAGRVLASLGSRFVWAGRRALSPGGAAAAGRRRLRGFPIAEDGIGLVRRFEDGLARC